VYYRVRLGRRNSSARITKKICAGFIGKLKLREQKVKRLCRLLPAPEYELSPTGASRSMDAVSNHALQPADRLKSKNKAAVRGGVSLLRCAEAKSAGAAAPAI
jgi:hypothetical protein